jgi:hypothetical protein
MTRQLTLACLSTVPQNTAMSTARTQSESLLDATGELTPNVLTWITATVEDAAAAAAKGLVS